MNDRRTRVWLLALGDGEGTRPLLAEALNSEQAPGFELHEASHGETSFEGRFSASHAEGRHEIVVLCLEQSKGPEIREVCDWVRRTAPGIPLVFATQNASLAELRELLALGPDELISAPF